MDFWTEFAYFTGDELSKLGSITGYGRHFFCNQNIWTGSNIIVTIGSRGVVAFFESEFRSSNGSWSWPFISVLDIYFHVSCVSSWSDASAQVKFTVFLVAFSHNSVHPRMAEQQSVMCINVNCNEIFKWRTFYHLTPFGMRKFFVCNISFKLLCVQSQMDLLSGK